MKIIYVTAWDDKGEAFNGRKIHDYLNRNGDESHMVVKYKSSTDKNIHVAGNYITQFLDKTIIPIKEKLFGLWAILPTSGWFSDMSSSDLVHVQAIHGESFFSLLTVMVISWTKPVIWTVHDFWPMTGHCTYPMDCTRWINGCGDCPNLNLPVKSLWDNTAFTWNLKHWIMHHSNITLVVASEYMKRNVRKSPILNNLPVRVIPFGIEQKEYDKITCREELEFLTDKFIIAYRVVDRNDVFKGMPIIQGTIDQLVLIPSMRCRISLLPISGWETDHKQVMKRLAAADIFLMPSLAESFGLMAIESMSVGTPVICLDITALPEVIGNGGIAVPGCIEYLVDIITTLINNPSYGKEIGENGKRRVKEKFGIDRYISDHIKLYREILA